MSFPRITTTADQMAGVPCIRGLRVLVATVVEARACGRRGRRQACGR
ncbi:MAG: DUF433 domain-containing protein [Thermoleophilia bacterium]|nr:DUF433 domain-containing protein [Thermoleophilia bacterium]